MKILMPFLVFVFSITTGYSQSKAPRDLYLHLSGGRVSFGTGDFLGYSFAFEAAKNLVRKPTLGLGKFLVGGEMIFENGVKNPVIENPTQEEFFSTSFNQVSNTILWAKASYHPFPKGLLGGFNIQLGPTAAYSQRSYEVRATRVVDVLGNSTRTSTLGFDNSFTVGYRISTGFDIDFGKKYCAGFRLDFANNTEGEINTLLGLKMGVRL